ncbi:MAG: hypothetical protein IT444_13125 [Phycisphaeraceae bacterium]|nr:hypothetical protein [Phycisphaeraceae bacterium]
MLHRKSFIVMALSASLLSSVAPSMVRADEPAAEQSAEQLYEEGMQKFASGDYAAAEAIFNRVDPVQLPSQDRTRMKEVLSQMASSNAAGTSASSQLAQAAEARQNGELKRAESLYEAVLKNPNASDAERSTAKSGLADAKRARKPEVAKQRAIVDSAANDIQEGKLDSAEKKLTRVKKSGVDLGWFDNQRVDSQLQLIAERRAEMGTIAAAADSSSSSGPVYVETTHGISAPAPQVNKEAEAAPVKTSSVVTETTQSPAVVSETTPVAGASDDLLAQARHLRAQQQLAEGRQAEEAGQLRAAASSYQSALSLDPSNEQAKAALAAVQARTGGAADAPRDILDTQLSAEALRTQQVIAEVQALMNKAESFRQEGKYSQAIEAVQQAKVSLDRNEQRLPSARYRAMREEAVNFGARLQDEQRLAEAKQKQETEKTKVVEEQREEARILNEREQEVQRLIRRAMALRAEQKYDQTIEVLNQALFIDPNNDAVDALKQMVEDSRLYVKTKAALRNRELAIAHQSTENIEATIPFTELMVYPSDWPQLTQRRLADLGATGGESKVNLDVMAKLHEPVPVNFTNNKLVNVIEYLKNTTGLNFFVNWNALSEAGIEQDMPITLELTNVAADEALALVIKLVSRPDRPINYAIREGVVNIDTVENLVRNPDTRVYDIRDLLHRIEPIKSVPSFDIGNAFESGSDRDNSSGSGSGSGSGSSSDNGLFGDDSSSSNSTSAQSSAEDRQKQIDELIELIQTTVGNPEDWSEAGGGGGSLKELNGNLIIKATAELHQGVTKLLTLLRETRAMQIAVEGRFLLVDQNFLDEIGVDLDVTITNPGGKFGPISINNDTIGLAQRQSSSMGNTFPATGTLTTTPTMTIPGTGGPTGTGRSFDIGINYLDDIQVNLIVTATQANRRSITLTAPRVTFINGNDAFVFVGKELTYIAELEAIPGTTALQQTPDTVTSGMLLYVKGTISADRRYVTLTVRPLLRNVSRLRAIEQTVVTTPTTGTGTGTGSAIQTTTGTIELPELETTTVDTTVSVPDKGTLLLGGQRLVGEVEVEAGVPVLSKIPLLNRVFTNRSMVKDERTLLLLIKPTIIIPNEQEEDLFPGLLANPAAYNVTKPLD